jgi:hypothetical protein
MTSQENNSEESPDSTYWRPLGNILIGLVHLSVVILFLRIPMAIASYEWPTVEGVIVSSEVSSTGLDEYFCTDIRYQYVVNGIEYVSTRVEVQDVCTNSRNTARSTVSRYPSGKIVELYYNPTKPTFAVLVPGLPAHNSIVILIMVFIFGFGVILTHKGFVDLYSYMRERR